ncbi:MAG TPA: hypothetical protein VMH01_08735 [Puia sp.]|nr:hypothetical protein [Puia sp.]
MSPKKEIQFKFLIICLPFLMMGCINKPDFSKIKKGMKTPEVIRLVGIPDRKQPMNTTTWWIYKDEQHHLIIIDNDTVSNCLTEDEAMKIMNEVLKTFDSTYKK